MKRVTGIGGVFIKSGDPARLRDWYKRHLGIDFEEWGGFAFRWKSPDNPAGEGTTVFVRGDVADGKLANLRVVEKPAELEDLLQIRMWQEPKMADTFLIVTNHFHEIIKYRAAMLLPQSENFRRTSSCAVLGDGRVGYEHWPHTIVQLVLVDFTFVGADADEIACE